MIKKASCISQHRRRTLTKAGERITKNEEIIIASEESRFQEENKRIALDKLCEMIRDACPKAAVVDPQQTRLVEKQ